MKRKHLNGTGNAINSNPFTLSLIAPFLLHRLNKNTPKVESTSSTLPTGVVVPQFDEYTQASRQVSARLH